MSKKIKFELTVPDWVPSIALLKYKWQTLKYKLNPFRCEECNTRMSFKHPQYEGYPAPYQRLGIHNTKKSLCPSCLNAHIKDFFSTSKDVEVAECTCCGQKKKTVDIIWGLDDNSPIDIRFLTRWWNGNPVCLDCINTTLANPTQRSNFILWQDGKSYYVNEKGALIDVC